MLKQRRKAADQVAQCLFSAEAAIDLALTRTAALAAAMPAVRADAHLSALCGQDAVEWVSETISALIKARRGIVETHKELVVVKDQIGLGAVAYGEGIKPPAAAPASPKLRSVGDEAAA